MKKIIIVTLMLMLTMVVACKSKTSATENKQKEVKQEKETVMPETAKKFSEPKIANVDPTKKYIAVIKTSKGEIKAELFPKEAPLSVANFKQLADGGFYTGLTFHRVVPNFVVQGGDPTATGAGGPGYTIPAEINKQHIHKKGALAWARTGDAVNPERRSSGSQFYITLEATPFLDGQYTVFGQTLSGMEVVDQLRQGDKIESVEVKAE